MNGSHDTRLVTVSSPEFLLGTRVMLDSFLQHNSWFDGEILVLHSRLAHEASDLLQAQFPNLVCRKASPRLTHIIDQLVAAFPHLQDRRDRFLSLETLLMEPSETTLFLDSDIVVVGSIADLAIESEKLRVCPDATLLRGQLRHRVTMEEVDHSDADSMASFNAGMILIGENAIDAGLHDRLFACLDPQCWSAVKSDHTDQLVWNRLFHDRAVLADPCYNFMLGHAGLYSDGDRAPANMRVLHFNGPAKPWLPQHQQAVAQKVGLTSWAFEQWRLACSAMLSRQRTT
jgi:hypothetical protein